MVVLNCRHSQAAELVFDIACPFLNAFTRAPGYLWDGLLSMWRKGLSQQASEITCQEQGRHSLSGISISLPPIGLKFVGIWTKKDQKSLKKWMWESTKIETQETSYNFFTYKKISINVKKIRFISTVSSACGKRWYIEILLTPAIFKICSKFALNLTELLVHVSCHYQEFTIISDTKVISPLHLI